MQLFNKLDEILINKDSEEDETCLHIRNLANYICDEYDMECRDEVLEWIEQQKEKLRKQKEDEARNKQKDKGGDNNCGGCDDKEEAGDILKILRDALRQKIRQEVRVDQNPGDLNSTNVNLINELQQLQQRFESVHKTTVSSSTPSFICDSFDQDCMNRKNKWIEEQLRKKQEEERKKQEEKQKIMDALKEKFQHEVDTRINDEEQSSIGKGFSSFLSSRGLYTAIIAISALYILYLVIQFIRKNRQDVGGSTEYTYMYESGYDFEAYQQEDTPSDRGFEYNQSINGSQEPTRNKTLRGGTYDDRGRKIKKVKKTQATSQRAGMKRQISDGSTTVSELKALHESPDELQAMQTQLIEGKPAKQPQDAESEKQRSIPYKDQKITGAIRNRPPEQ